MQLKQHLDLPPLGPAWAGALMGTSILATLAGKHAQDFDAENGALEAFFHGLFSDFSVVMLIVASIVAVCLIIGAVRYREPGFNAESMPPWGMVSMGLLALGSVYSGITHLWSIHIVLWVIGGTLSFLTCGLFLAHVLRGRAGTPAYTWGLPLVAPMVTATSSAQLSTHFGEINTANWIIEAVHTIGVVGFFMALIVSVPVFGFVYFKVAKGTTIPLDQAATPWIPLGIVGQSVAAAHLLSGNGDTPMVVRTYTVVMLTLGVPMGLWALYRHWSAATVGLRSQGNSEGMQYNPTWWSSTFPVGTLCLGTHLSALRDGVVWLDTVSLVLFVLLLAHWIWAAAGARQLFTTNSNRNSLAAA